MNELKIQVKKEERKTIHKPAVKEKIENKEKEKTDEGFVNKPFYDVLKK